MKKKILSKLTEAIYLFIDGKVKTQQQIADFIGINKRTLQRWLLDNGFKTNHKLYTPSEQIRIFRVLGYLDDD